MSQFDVDDEVVASPVVDVLTPVASVGVDCGALVDVCGAVPMAVEARNADVVSIGVVVMVVVRVVSVASVGVDFGALVDVCGAVPEAVEARNTVVVSIGVVVITCVLEVVLEVVLAGISPG
jgi:hypothetical protein